MRFLFVHGTGVRRERHDSLFGLVRERLAGRFPGADVDSCYWGDRFGANLGVGGRSVPGLRPGPEAEGADAETAAWALLIADPLCEVRVLAEAGWEGGEDDDGFAMPGVRSEGARVLGLLAAVRDAFPPAEAPTGARAGRAAQGVDASPAGHGADTGHGGATGHAAGVAAVADGAGAADGAGRVGASTGAPAGEAAHGVRVGGVGELGALLRGTGLGAYLSDALDSVARSAEVARAGERAVDAARAAELATVLARAVTAGALASAGVEADCTGAERDRLVELLTTRLGGDARVPGARAAAVLGRLALRVTTQPLLNARRGSLTVGATPALGDILRYQARGHALRAFLHAEITSRPGPTVLIGHSLGGIALVDLLALSAARGEPVPGVELLVTVGSQAPFLYELGALTALEPGEKLPYGFPRWLNVYDRQDVLAYLAAPVFPGDPRISDHEVGSRQPFPACHGAYWKQNTLYERIGQAVTEAGIG
ncbi:hypothetical protein ACFXD5_08105 [Streptomyces sp. NPDC059385]|uniref:hypothetical protein n=1 Tax=Streptomyces sp. NPDC059385 TaxID=3346817 RepID=UPI0036BD8A20